MPPREFESIPRESVLLSHEEGHDQVLLKIPQLKIVGKALDLPLVADAVSLTRSTISPLVETMTPVAEKVEEQVASFIRTRAEESLLPHVSEGVKTNLTSAVEQVSAAVTSLDNLACEGLDQLTERVPVLRGPTPEVLETAKEVATSSIGLLAEYLASFTLTQVALQVGEASLSMVDSTLKRTGLEKKMPVSIGNVRREARVLRRAGMRRAIAESSTAKTIGEVSLLGAVAEIMGVNFFLSAVGLQLVQSNKSTAEEATATFDMGKVGEVVDSDDEDEMTVQQRLSPEKLDAYESDKDPDYSPSEASEDSLEYNSDAEEVTEPIESAVDVVCCEDGQKVVDSDEDDKLTVQQRLSPEKLDSYESDNDPDYCPSEASVDSLEYASDAEEVVEPVESAVLYEDEHATVIAEAAEVEKEPVVVDTESGDVVDDETKDSAADPVTLTTPATPLIDTQGFAAVSVAVAALEAAVVPENLVPKETAVTEDPAEVVESENAVVTESVEESVDYETKKVNVRFVTEANEDIEIVDIDNEEDSVVEDDEGDQIDYCPK